MKSLLNYINEQLASLVMFVDDYGVLVFTDEQTAKRRNGNIINEIPEKVNGINIDAHGKADISNEKFTIDCSQITGSSLSLGQGGLWFYCNPLGIKNNEFVGIKPKNKNDEVAERIPELHISCSRLSFNSFMKFIKQNKFVDFESVYITNIDKELTADDCNEIRKIMGDSVNKIIFYYKQCYHHAFVYNEKIKSFEEKMMK